MPDPNYSSVHVSPVTGFLDTRSTPDEVPFGGYRWIENMEVTAKRRLCRAYGFRRFLEESPYNNADLHDQLGEYARQPLTSGFMAESVAGFSKLLIGTQTRIYALNTSSRNWKVISDQLGGTAETGCSERRFRYGQVNNTVVITNNFDKPHAHIIDQPSLEGGDQAVTVIGDLEFLKISKVAVVIGWNNVMFYMNMVADGERVANQILWSDYKRPLSLRPGVSSIAGGFTLDTGESILAAIPLVDRMLILTTRAIWEAVVVGGDQRFAFNRRYKAPKGNLRCLAYPNTLVSTGSEILYWGEDGIYAFSLYDHEPRLVDWIHRATAAIFDDLNKAKCQVHTGAYYENKKTIYWSWAREGEDCPSMTLTVNTEFPFCSIIPVGFTLFLNYELDSLLTLRDWVLDNCICTVAELDTYGYNFGSMEGGYCYGEPSHAACAKTPNSFYSLNALTFGDITVEDYTGSPDANSLYTILGSLRLEDICAAELLEDECNSNQLFLMVSAEDNCIKEAAAVYYREICTSTVGCGVYEQRGYRSLMRSGAMHLKDPSNDKIVNRFAVEAHPQPASVPAQFIVRIGVSNQAVDPGTSSVRSGQSGKCAIVWTEELPVDLECLSEVDMAKHIEENTRPNEEMEWGLFHTARFFYYEMEIVNAKVTPPDTGGGCCFSRFTFDVASNPRMRH